MDIPEISHITAGLEDQLPPAALAIATRAVEQAYDQGRRDGVLTLMNVAEAAVALGVSEIRVRQLALADGTGLRSGGWLFPPELVESWRGQRVPARAKRYKTPAAWAASVDTAREEAIRDQAETQRTAKQSSADWSSADDQIIVDRINDPPRVVALDLGRTLYAVRARRDHLRKRGRIATDQSD